MKKAIALAVMIAICLFVIVQSQFATVFAFPFDGFLVPNNAPAQSLEGDLGKEEETITLQDAEATGFLYAKSGKYYVGGEKKQAVNLRYPMYINGGTALMTMDDSFKIWDETFESYKTFQGMILTDGQIYDLDNELLDRTPYILLSTPEGLFQNLKLMTVKTAMHEYFVPMNSLTNFEEKMIRYYDISDSGVLTYHLIPDVDYASAIYIGDVSMSYNDFLRAIGKMTEPVTAPHPEETVPNSVATDPTEPTVAETKAPANVAVNTQQQSTGTASGTASNQAGTGNNTTGSSTNPPVETVPPVTKPQETTPQETVAPNKGNGDGNGDGNGGNHERPNNTNKGDRPANPKPSGGSGNTGSGGGNSSSSNQTGTVEWKKPEVVAHSFVPGVYQITGSVTISDPAGALKNGAVFQLYSGDRLSMRKVFYSTTDAAVIGGLVPGETYTIKGTITYYKDGTKTETVTEEFYSQEITLNGLESMVPLQLHIDQGEYASNSAYFENMQFSGDCLETVSGIRNLEIHFKNGLTDAVSTISSANLLKLQNDSGIPSYRSVQNLTANKEWTISFVAYDLYGSKLPISAEPILGTVVKDSVAKTLTTKNQPTYTLRMDSVIPGTVTMTLTQVSDRDKLGSKNLCVKVFDKETGKLLQEKKDLTLTDGAVQLSFKDLPANQNCIAKAYCDGEIYDGWGEQTLELVKMNFTTDPISAMGELYLNTGVTLDESDSTKAKIALRVLNNTSSVLRNYLSEIQLKVVEDATGETARTFTFTSEKDENGEELNEEFKTLMSGELLDLQVQGLKGITDYHIEASSAITYGSDKIAIPTNITTDSFTTYKTMATAYVQDVFTNGNYITFDAMVMDLEDVIAGDIVYVRVRQKGGAQRLIYKKELKVCEDLADMEYAHFEVTENVEAGMDYVIEFYADEFNRGTGNATKRSGVFDTKELTNTRIAEGSIYLMGTQADGEDYIADISLNVKRNVSANTDIDSMRYYVQVLEGNDASNLHEVQRTTGEVDAKHPLKDYLQQYRLSADRYYEFRLYADIPGHELLLGTVSFETDRIITPVSTPASLEDAMFSGDGKYVVTNNITAPESMYWDTLRAMDMQYQNIMLREDMGYDFNGYNSYISPGKFSRNIDMKDGWELEIKFKPDVASGTQYLWDSRTGIDTDTSRKSCNLTLTNNTITYNYYFNSTDHKATLLTGIKAGVTYEIRLVVDKTLDKNLKFYLKENGAWVFKGAFAVGEHHDDADWNYNNLGCRASVATTPTGVAFPNSGATYPFDGKIYRFKFATTAGVIVDLDPTQEPENAARAVELDRYENMEIRQNATTGEYYYYFNGKDAYIELPWMDKETVSFSDGFTTVFDAQWSQKKNYANILYMTGKGTNTGRINIREYGTADQLQFSVQNTTEKNITTGAGLGLTSRHQYRITYRAADTGIMNTDIRQWVQSEADKGASGWMRRDWWTNLPRSYMGGSGVTRFNNFVGRGYVNGSYPDVYFYGSIYGLTIYNQDLATYAGESEDAVVIRLNPADDIELIEAANQMKADRTAKRNHNNEMLDKVFTGEIDFQGFTLTKDTQGAFLPYSSGTIKNVVLDVTGNSPVGSVLSPVLVGQNRGVISNVQVNYYGTTEKNHSNVGAITLSNYGTVEDFAIIMYGTAYSERMTGMAAVHNYGTIRNGYVSRNPTSALSFTIDSSAVDITSSLTSRNKAVGGLVGYNAPNGNVSYVYSTISARSFNGQPVGLLIGYTEGRASSGYASGSAVPQFSAYGPAIAGVGGSASNFLNYAGFHYNDAGGQNQLYNNSFNYPVNMVTIAEISWQKARLDNGAFDIETYVKMNYYPHVLMNSCMPDQPLVPITDAGADVAVTDLQVIEYYNEDMTSTEKYGKQALVKFKVYNPGLNKPIITDIDIANLDVQPDTDLQEDPLGDYSYVYAYVKVDPTQGNTGFGVYQNQYTVNSVTLNGNVTYYNNSSVDLPFWKPICSVSGGQDPDGYVNGWCETIVKHPDQNYIVTQNLDFAGTSVQDFQINDAFSGQLIGWKHDGARPTLQNMNLGGESHLFSWTDDVGGSVGYNAIMQNLCFSNITMGSTVARNAGLVKQLSGVMDGVSIQNSSANGYENVGLLVSQCQTLGRIRNCSAVDCDIVYHDTPWFAGEHAVGAIAALAKAGSTIENCFARGQSITMHDSYSNAGGVGSLVGISNGGTLISCYAQGTIEAFGDNVGGVIGSVRVPTESADALSYQITDLYSKVFLFANGSNVGGLIGYVESGSPSVRGLALGDISNAKSGAANVHPGVGYAGGDASGLNIYAVESLYYNGNPHDSVPGFDGNTVWLSETQFESADVYGGTVGLSGSYTDAGENILPKLLRTDKSGLLPDQTDLNAVDDRHAYITAVSKDAGSNINNPRLIIEVTHEADKYITGLTFEGGYLVTYEPTIQRISDYRTILIYTVKVDESKAMDTYRVVSAQYRMNDTGPVYTTKCDKEINFVELFGQGLYKIIYNSDQWYSYMTENMDTKLYQNYRVAENAVISMAERINVPHNLYIGHLEGMGSGATVQDIILNLSGEGMGGCLILKERGSVTNLTFRNISIISGTQIAKTTADYGITAGVIGTSYGHLENLHFDHVAVTSSNGGGFVGAVGHKADGDMLNCTAVNTYINYDNVVSNGTVAMTESSKIHTQTASQAGRCGALVGLWSSYGHMDLNGTESSHVQIHDLYVVGGVGYLSTGTELTDTNEKYVSTGGLVGSIFYRHAGMQYVDFKNITVTCSNGTFAGGVIGTVAGVDNANTSNASNYSHISLENVTVTAKDTVGGFIGRFSTGVKLEDISLKDITINGSSTYIGGLFGYGYTGTANTMTDIRGENITVNNPSGGNYTGGLIGYAPGASTTLCYTIRGVDLKNVTVKGRGYSGGVIGQSTYNKIYDLTLKDFSVTVSGSYSYVGGVAGYLNVGRLENAEIGISAGSTTRNSVKGYHQLGGVIGLQNNAVVTKVNIRDTDVSSTSTYVGSVVGNVDNGASQDTQITVTNCSVTSTVSNDTGCIGGAFGDVPGTVNNVVVINTPVTALKAGRVGGVIGNLSTTKATGCKYISTQDTPVEIKAKNYIGGITGYATSTVEKSLTENVTITATDASTGGTVGWTSSTVDGTIVKNITINAGTSNPAGIAGYSAGTVKNCVAQDVTIQSNNACNNIGGIVGHCNGGTVTGNTMERLRVNMPQGSRAGGIAGYARGNVSNCSAYNVNISAKQGVGGVAGRVGNLDVIDSKTKFTVSNSYLNNADSSCKLAASESQAGGVAGCVHRNGVITGCYAHTDVTAPVAVGGLAGCFENNDIAGEKIIYDDLGNPTGSTPYHEASLAQLKNSYFDGNLSGEKGIGGVVGVMNTVYSQESQSAHVRPINNLVSGVTITATESCGGFDVGGVGTVSGMVAYNLSNPAALREENLTVYEGATLTVNGTVTQAKATNAFPEVSMPDDTTQPSVKVVSKDELLSAETYAEIFDGAPFALTKLADNCMPFLSGISYTLEGQVNAYTRVAEITYMPYVAIPEMTILGLPGAEEPETQNLKMALRRAQLTVYAYPSGVNTVTVQVPGLRAGDALSVVCGDGTILLNTTADGDVFSFIYDYRDNFTVETEMGSAVVYLDNISRKVMAYGSHGYYIAQAGICDEHGNMVRSGSFVHMYDGMAIAEDGTVVTIAGSGSPVAGANGQKLSLPLGVLRCYADGTRYDIFTDRTIMSDGTVVGGMRYYFKDGNSYCIAATDTRTPVDSVFCFTDGTSTYQTILYGSTLIDTKEPSPMLQNEDFNNSRIAYIANNLNASAPYLLIAYNDGTLVGYNYLSGEELFRESGSAVSVLEYMVSGISQLSETGAGGFSMNQKMAKSYSAAKTMASFLSTNYGTVADLLTSGDLIVEGGDGERTEEAEESAEKLNAMLSGMDEAMLNETAETAEKPLAEKAEGEAQTAEAGEEGIDALSEEAGALTEAEQALLPDMQTERSEENETELSDKNGGEKTVKEGAAASAASMSLGRENKSAQTFMPVFNADEGKYALYSEEALLSGDVEQSVDEKLEASGVFISSLMGEGIAEPADTETNGVLIFSILTVVIFSCGLAFAGYRSKKTGEVM